MKITPLAASIAIVSVAVPAAAQRSPMEQRAMIGQLGTPPARVSLKETFGVPAALRLLESESLDDRLRGVVRLGAMGTDEALDALVAQLDQVAASSSVDSVKLRLEAVRVLAPYAARDNVLRHLLHEAMDTSLDGRSSSTPLGSLLRGSAAFAVALAQSRAPTPTPTPVATSPSPLPTRVATSTTAAPMLWATPPSPGTTPPAAASNAASGHGSTLVAPVTPPAPSAGARGLAIALLSSGTTVDITSRALKAHPPASLDAFLDSKWRLGPQAALVLAELGDLRVIGRLREMVVDKDVAGQLGAAIALAKLGDDAARPAAIAWLKKTEPRLRRTAAEVLVYLGAPEGSAAVGSLFGSDATRDDGLRLALLAPSPELAGPISEALATLPAGSRERAVAAVGRCGGPRAIQELTALLRKPELATAAAQALATMPGDAARVALEQAIAAANAAGGAPKRRLIRAAIVRALVLGDAPSGLRAALGAMLGAEAAADRAVAAFGSTALGLRSLRALAARSCGSGACDTAILAAAARGALARDPSELEALWPILARASVDGGQVGHESPIAVAAGLALLTHPEGGDLPTAVLATWAEAGGALSPLCARALASRDDAALRGRLKRLLAGSDPVVRAHVALGLARDPEASAASLLTSAYRFEDDPGVRRAIIRALSLRAEGQRLPTLVLARDLDPDDEVRALARSALLGRILDPGLHAPGGVEAVRSTAWISVESNDAASASPEAMAVRLVRPDGLAVPALTDPDGALLVPGVSSGRVSLWIASERGLDTPAR